jgi:hypothetical protein
MRKLTIVAVLFGAATVALVARPSSAADLYRATLVPGADAGTGAALTGTWLPGNQFMLSCNGYSGVTYRLCPAADAGLCSAFAVDAPVEANKQVDLCAPTAYTSLAVFKTYDGGNPSCNVYSVTPKTVCQTP